MPNTSASGGYLAPSSTTHVEDDAFENFIGSALAGISGLPRANVRPRWQANPPAMPAIDIDWCAFGITTIESDFGSVKLHRPDGDGSDEFQRHETVAILASFYGPHGYSLATRTRDGLMIAQNREALRAGGVTIRDCRKIRTASDLMNERWVRRIDLEIELRCAVVRSYPILNVHSALGEFVPNAGDAQPFTISEN